MADQSWADKRGEKALKRELRGIVETYHHYWDVVAEMLQNSRDAVARAKREDGTPKRFIRISMDAATRTIEVLDNGCGISTDLVIEMLNPGGGDKEDIDLEVGEKGVGLTYCICRSSGFELETKTKGNEPFGLSISGMWQWMKSKEVLPPPGYSEFNEKDFSITETEIKLSGETYSLDSYAKIKLKGVPQPEEGKDIFDHDLEQMKYLLLTRTAVGVTDNLFNDDFEADFDFFYDLNLKGENSEGDLNPGYPRPHELLANPKRLDDIKNAFMIKTSTADRKKYIDKSAIWGTHTVKKGDETIRVYGVMLPGNKVFAELSEDPLRIEEAEGVPEEERDDLFRSGIFLATKNMPTGVSIPEGKGGGKYLTFYKRCCFVVESDKIKFDIGRKSLHHVPRKRLQKAVTDLYSFFEPLAQYQSDERPERNPKGAPKETKAEREARIKKEWDRLEKLVDLKIGGISYQKVPDRQEAAIAAIFHELIGAKKLTKYQTLGTGYKQQYDLHARYVDPDKTEPLNLLIEFKYSLEAVVDDFLEGVKNFSEIDIFVAWNGSEQKLKDSLFELDVAEDPPYEGVTHQLRFPPQVGIDPVPVILLEEWHRKKGAI
ncbi:ATP-binding protein [Marinobacter nauticus]|uniref:ATP-binding protein n=1 Tax=Marinobacter nauticus TaxID=2743 RepID=UPI0040448DE5